MVFLGAKLGPQTIEANNMASRMSRRHTSTQREQQKLVRPVVSLVRETAPQQHGAPNSRIASLLTGPAVLDGPLDACISTTSGLEQPPQQHQQSALHGLDLPLAHHPCAGDPLAADAAAHYTAPAARGGASTSGTTSSYTHNISSSSSSSSHQLPDELLRLADASAPVVLPPPRSVPPGSLDNRELDKLVGTLGRSKATWRRSLVLSQWLQESGHVLDDRLCTTLIRVCSEHAQAVTALSVYEWMKAPAAVGGAGLQPTVYTYTAAMRAALVAGLLDRALQVWEDAQAAACQLDCRLCITYIEVCSRKGLTERALAMYGAMKAAPRSSRLAPTVHAYTAAMRAATEGGAWAQALDIWADMQAAGIAPTGHAYAAAMSACAAGSKWQQAVSLFESMCEAGIRPDVVSCTALISALAAAGQSQRAEAVVQWMLTTGVRPNVRTYTALLTALGKARQWDRAFEMLSLMQHSSWGGVAPNAYTYSALLRCLGECGEWARAERLFGVLEQQALLLQQAAPAAAAGRSASAAAGSAAGLAAAATMAAVGGMQWPAAAAAAGAGAAAHPAAGSRGMAGSGGAGSAGPAAAAAVPLGARGDAEVVPGVWGWQAGGSGRRSLVQRPSFFGEEELHELAASSSSSSSPTNGVAQPQHAANEQQQQPQSLWTSASQLHGLDLQLQHEAAASSGSSSGSTTDSRSHSPTPGGGDVISQQAADGLVGAAAAAPAPASTSAVVAQQLAQLALQQQLAASMDLQAVMLAAANTGLPRGVPQQQQQQRQQVARIGRPPTGPVRTAQQQQQQHQQHASNAGGSKSGAGGSVAGGSGSGGGPINEVVVRSLMLAYEQAGKWQECIGALRRGAALGVAPSAAMYSIAISVAGRAGQPRVADALFAQARAAGAADASTYEAMVAVLGMAGDAPRAEVVLRAMQAAGHTPGEYAWCGLIAAYSLAGDHVGAQRVRTRIIKTGGPASVGLHVYNALLAAADRSGAYDRALELLRCMQREGVQPDGLTQQLAVDVGRKGAVEVEGQQLTAAALSAAMAAAGTLLIRSGVF